LTNARAYRTVSSLFPELIDLGCCKALSESLPNNKSFFVMQTILLFAVVMFLLGLFVGLPYHRAYKRRLSLMEKDKDQLAEKENGVAPLDKQTTYT
jgi:hypothetical protein